MSWFKKKQPEPILMATALFDMYMLGQVIRQGEKYPADSPFVQLKPDSFIVTVEDMEKHRG